MFCYKHHILYQHSTGQLIPGIDMPVLVDQLCADTGYSLEDQCGAMDDR